MWKYHSLVMNEAGSDFGIYVPSDTSDEGTFVFSLWDYL